MVCVCVRATDHSHHVLSPSQHRSHCFLVTEHRSIGLAWLPRDALGPRSAAEHPAYPSKSPRNSGTLRGKAFDACPCARQRGVADVPLRSECVGYSRYGCNATEHAMWRACVP